MTDAFPIPAGFRELDAVALPAVLAGLAGVASRLGGTQDTWNVREVSDGNMNAVFRVDGPGGSVIAKQSLPYIRVIGESWPFPVDRIDYEHRALGIQARHCRAYVPEIYAYEPHLALLVIETLSPHIIARKGFVAGIRYPRLAGHLGSFLARSLFFTSDFALTTPQKKQLSAEFAGNAILCATTEDVIFTGPYWDAPLNRVTPGVETMAASFRGDAALKRAATEMKHAFRTRSEALIHGDLHTGSLMVTGTETKIIDPEWAFHGPMGFDIGAVIGNLLLAFFSQPGHATKDDDRKNYADWILETIAAVWSHFESGFRGLCDSEGVDLFEPQMADDAVRSSFVDNRLAAVFGDAVGFAGAKMIRRIIGISHVEDLESIADVERRAACEMKALTAARQMLLNRADMAGIGDVVALARSVSARG